ncbi:MAG: hypothetical protein R8L53_02510 [Mariprofundales bacterium]
MSVIFLLMLPILAIADDDKKEAVSIHMEAYKIVFEDDVEKRRSADAAGPSDVIEYVATYTNNTTSKIKDLLATLPIPQGTEYIANTTKPKKAKASLDGAQYAAIPLQRKVKLPSGKWVTELVPYEEYRFLRWNLKTLKAEKSKDVSARMRVAPLSEATPDKGGAN